MGSFYGFQAAGVNPQNGRMMYEKANGMLVYEEDLSADEDRQILGCAQPKFLYGINNVFSYKNFDLSFFFQGSYGNDIYNATRMFTEGMFDSRNQSDRVLMLLAQSREITLPFPVRRKINIRLSHPVS